MNHAIILAGGAGTRFWPLSRTNSPKQFLRLYSDKPMLEQTIRRISPFINRHNIYIATNKIYHKKVSRCLRGSGVPRENIFLEPQAKNTLAPIGLLSKNIYAKDKHAVVAVLPCDHYIKNKAAFLKILDKAVKQAGEGYIVTLGIKPTYPETGYGYIKVKSGIRSPKICKVERFLEKPDINKAKEFLNNKKYYWNAGIFVFRPQILLDEVKKLAPREYAVLSKINNKRDLNRLWKKFTAVSIDYAIMQKSKRLGLLPADCGWVDLGSWRSIEYFSAKDKAGNIFKGNCIDTGSRDTLAWSDGRLLATVGLNGMIVVNTEDAILVCDKNKTQDVKLIVQALNLKKQYKQI